MRKLTGLFWAIPLVVGAAIPANVKTGTGSRLACGENVRNFTLTAKVVSEKGAEARLAFHADGALKGYQILFKNGPIDGSRKTGSLAHVRNLYHSQVADGEPYDFELSVREKNVEVKVAGQTVVRYTEPARPWRLPAHSRQLLSRGDFVFLGDRGEVKFTDVKLTPLADGVLNPADTMPPVDEQTDRAIRKQQIDFPVIDYHVHLKGGLTKELAHAKSLNYGINYGVCPNVGEGGVGRMFRTNEEALDYLEEVKTYPFMCGAQGEGRKWPHEFRKDVLLRFDYMFTDSMTIVDNHEALRVYRREEFRLNGRSHEEWMDFLVDQIVKILTNEPVDHYANATYLPPEMNADYDRYWTDARVNRVLDVLEKNDIALEISARYRIPSARVIKMAKARGIKFTFGTNNADADFGRLEYALDMVDECGLTAEDMWFPTMSIRARRDFVPYNTFKEAWPPRLERKEPMPTNPPPYLVKRPAVIPIDVGRQLFVDDYLLDRTEGLTRVYNHPVKMFDGPVLWPETPIELEEDVARPHRFAPVCAATSGGLWWDPVKKVFRLWYEAGWMKNLCYAESKDGVAWTRPDCGIVKGTNRVLTDALLDSWNVFPDYTAANPYGTWKLMVSVAGGTTDNRLYSSSDGTHWDFRGLAGQSGDRTTFFYNPFRGKWVYSLRGGGPGGGGRNRSYWESRDFGGPEARWNFSGKKAPPEYQGLPAPHPWLATDALDLPDPAVAGRTPQLYNVDAVAYESLMLGMFEILHPGPKDNGSSVEAGMPKITDLQFAYSRDGWHFTRPDRTAAIASSRWGTGKWDSGYLSPMGGICVIKDERLWFYYTGMRGDATETTPYQNDPEVGWRRNGMHFNASIGVASLRRDGFVGLVADGRGEAVTHPVRFSGAHLFVNAECRFGSLAVEVLDEAGRVIPGFEAKDCRAVRRTDSTKAEVTWTGASVKALAGRNVQFRFKLHCGTLYAFWVSPSSRGESRGYLAAGGPAYSGLRDL